MNKKVTTPTKTFYRMSPSCTEICILCQVDIDNTNNKYRLWDKYGNKNNVCNELEEYLNTRISRNTDFQSICRVCSLANKRMLGRLRGKKLCLEAGRKSASEHFIRSKTKRLSKDDGNTSTKKKLHYHDDAEIHFAKLLYYEGIH